jgi:hypothetical protein
VTAPYGHRFTAAERAEGLASSPAAGPDAGQLDLVAGIQQRQAERDRLLGVCQQLRASHRCPGRCVFSGELRQGGLAAFHSALDGRA